jgi:environmental stress-induced protein Ves
MESKFEIVRKSEFQTSQWSGGTTTQLCIYPADAKYSERNFKWRLSSARVETEESEFTRLPGISRIIMIIDGRIVLEHQGKHRAELGPFEQDSFMGDWTTKSHGKVTDFNLMMADGCCGKLKVLSLAGGGSARVRLNETEGCTGQVTNAFYAVSEDVSAVLQNKWADISEGDLLLVTNPADEETPEVEFHNQLSKEVNIIRAVVFY